MLEDADLNLPLLAESDGLLDRQLWTQVDVIVGDREAGSGGQRGREEMVCGGERGSGHHGGLHETSAGVGISHDWFLLERSAGEDIEPGRRESVTGVTHFSKRVFVRS